MGKNTFILSNSWAKRVISLPDDDFSAIVKAVFAYAIDIDSEALEGVYKAIADEMIDFIDENNEKYEATCQKRREAGSIGGKQKKANATKSKQNVANATKSKQNVPDNDNDNDLCNEKVKEGRINSTKEIDMIVQEWNNMEDRGLIPKVIDLKAGTTRYKMLNSRIAEYGVPAILEAIDMVKQSSFLKGRNNRGWAVDFEWFIKPNNFPKIREGKYSDTTPLEGTAKHDINQPIFDFVMEDRQ